MGESGGEPRPAAGSDHRRRRKGEAELMRFEDLPYRPCVGLMVLNRAGLCFIGRRVGGPEHVDLTHHWQLPQGGIDAGEEPWPAALRELREETNMSSVERIGEIADWLKYDIPREIVGEAWNGKYRGQMQKWFALRFTGADSEIDVENPAGAQQAEFTAWRWEAMRNVPGLVVPFKRAVYQRVVNEFAKLAAP
jgi:putative (di)nucleoside polyphosphate hydrolase